MTEAEFDGILREVGPSIDSLVRGGMVMVMIVLAVACLLRSGECFWDSIQLARDGNSDSVEARNRGVIGIICCMAFALLGLYFWFSPQIDKFLGF